MFHVEVPRVEYEKISDRRRGEPSAAVRARVEGARERQRRRFQGLSILTNGEMGPAEVHKFCDIDQAGQVTCDSFREVPAGPFAWEFPE